MTTAEPVSAPEVTAPAEGATINPAHSSPTIEVRSTSDVAHWFEILVGDRDVLAWCTRGRGKFMTLAIRNALIAAIEQNPVAMHELVARVPERNIHPLLTLASAGEYAIADHAYGEQPLSVLFTGAEVTSDSSAAVKELVQGIRSVFEAVTEQVN